MEPGPRVQVRSLLLFLLLVPAACGTTSRGVYHWGQYESCVGEICRGGDLGEQIRRLSTDVEKAQAQGLKTPPGVRLQLGWLYAQTGNPEAARIELEAERELYPESATIVGRLLARLGA